MKISKMGEYGTRTYFCKILLKMSAILAKLRGKELSAKFWEDSHEIP